MSAEVSAQFLRVWSSLIGTDIDPVRKVQFVAFISRKHMNVEVPKILVASGLIVLSRGSPITIVRGAYCNRYLFGNFVDVTYGVIRNIIDVFKVLVGDYDHMPSIIRPGSRSDKCGD